jgi:RHS repeat-associated protein
MNRFAFTGHYYDPETKLYNAKARYFDPKLGRFLTQDSYLGTHDNPPSLHRYLYGCANPLRYVDPTGHAAVRAGRTVTVDDEATRREWEEIRKEAKARTEPASDEARASGDVVTVKEPGVLDKARALVQGAKDRLSMAKALWDRATRPIAIQPSTGDPVEDKLRQTERTLEAGETLGEVGVAAGEAYLETAAGDLGDATAAATGTSVTGHKLTTTQRVIAGVLAAAPVIAASWFRSGERVVDAADDAPGLQVRGPNSRGRGVGQQQGREFRVESLEVNEFDATQPRHVRGWLAQERRRVETGRADTPRNPPGYVQAHGRDTPAREGFDYSNARLQNEGLNKLEEAVRRREGRE